MKNLIPVILIIVEIVLGGWCWSYSIYRNIINRAISHYELGQNLAAAVVLKEFRLSPTGNLYRRVPFLSRQYEQTIYGEAAARMRIGETHAAGELFRQISSSKHAEIQHASSYNLALLHIREGDFVSARAELSDALRIMPEDQDSKRNLEILVRKEKERLEEQSNQQGSIKPPQSMMKKESLHFPEDLWRFEMPKEGESSDAKIRRRYL